MRDHKRDEIDLERYLAGSASPRRRASRLARLAPALHWIFVFTSGVCFAVVVHWALDGSILGRSGRSLDGRVVDEVAEVVVENYVDERSREDLLQDALGGLTRNLDPYSVYIPPSDYPDFVEDTEGEYVGIGVLIEPRGEDETSVVISGVLPDGPAYRAGVRPGDSVVDAVDLAADGESRNRLPLRQRLKGPSDTAVRLELEREGDRRSVELKRHAVSLTSVSIAALLDPDAGVGYVRLSQFQSSTPDDFTAALKLLETRRELSGLVLDLRDNPGGVFRAAIDVATEFLDEGDVIVSTQGRGRRLRREVYRASRSGRWRELPLVVLLNGETASAAEIVCGALQDHGRGVLIGETSYGKGRVQTIYSVRRQPEKYGLLKITTQRFFTPAGRAIDRFAPAPGKRAAAAGGIRPDLALEIEGPDLFHDMMLRHFRDVTLEPWRQAAWPTEPPSYAPFTWENPETGEELRDLVLVRAAACLADETDYRSVLGAAAEAASHARARGARATGADPRF